MYSATARVFEQWRSIRSESVSMPWRNIHELSGEMQPPRLRSGTVSRRSRNASGARPSGRSWPQRRPPYELSGSSKFGCLPAPQLMLPLTTELSTTMPPTPVPWPPTHLVSEEHTMSAPNSKGLQRYGVENVESTTSGRPFSWASLEISSRSAISSAGFDTVSQKKQRVLSSMAATNAAGSLTSTKRTVMPILGRMSLNCV
mmetsp:Transcript_31841/g.73544  ORF Transcript_31841/g.73544 Transcript_31841/m.73544 type:complete len:201 (-) Transcript_31841:387-989(-)